MNKDEITSLSQKLDRHTEILGEIRSDLNYHIRRTDLLETTVKEQREEFKPVRRHVELVNSLAKVFMALVTISGVVAGILRLFH